MISVSKLMKTKLCGADFLSNQFSV